MAFFINFVVAMKMPVNLMNLKVIALCFVVYASLTCRAQNAEHVSYTQHIENGKAKYLITYDLIAAFDNIPCAVKVKVTTPQNYFYLEQLSGDAGLTVYPGLNKKIIWDYAEELVHFSGDLDLSIEVTPDVNVKAKVRRGKTIPITLQPVYTPNKTYAMILYRKGKEVTRLRDMLVIDNALNLELTKKIRPGKKYQILMTDGDRKFFSNTFKIKPKIGHGWKIVPLLAIPVYFLVNKTIKDNEALPAPPSID